MKQLINALLIIFLTTAIVYGQKTNSFNIDKTGTGEKQVILIPGFSCSGDVWEETINSLGDDYTYHSLTLAGFAGQTAQKDPQFDEWAEEISEYIQNEKLENTIVIGHSLGGMMALKLASDYPELIQEIIIVDALPSLAALQNPDFTPDASIDCSSFGENYTQMDDEQFLAMQKMTMYSMSSEQDRHEQLIEWSIASDRFTLGSIYCQLSNLDLREDLQHVNCPSLILMEAPFKSIDAQIQDQYKALKNADIRYSNKGLHFIMYDDTEWYLEQIKDFLK